MDSAVTCGRERFQVVFPGRVVSLVGLCDKIGSPVVLSK